MSRLQRSALHVATDGRHGRAAWRQPGAWPPYALALGLGVCFLGQWMLPDGPLWAGLSAQGLREGRWHTLLTHMLVHGGIGHLLFNGAALITLGAEVSAALARRRRSQWRFFVLFLLSGLAGAAALLLLNPYGSTPAVGASGAICGLWAAAARLAGPGVGLQKIISPTVLRITRGFLLMNLLIVGLALLLSQALFEGGGVRVAWEAHLGGYVAGLFLIRWLLPEGRPADPEPLVGARQGPWGPRPQESA
jgi:membrane associated rhomboid family serine protease